MPIKKLENIGRIFGFNGCNGYMNSIDVNYQWSANASCDTFYGYWICRPTYIKDLIVAPGCNLYLYGQPFFSFFEEAEPPSNTRVYNFINVIEGPNILHEYRKHVQSLVCSCDSASAPKDAWETILECDNRQGVAPTTCNYVKSVGTSFGSTNGTGGSDSSTSSSSSTDSGSTTKESSVEASISAGAFGISASASATLSASISESFSQSIGRSDTTGVNWNTVATNTFEETTSITITETVPAGKCVKVEQAVGYAGSAIVRTNEYRMTQNCKSTSTSPNP